MPPRVRVSIIAILLISTACGVEGEPSGLPSVDLPRLGTIGMSPYELDGPTLVVTIDAKGTVLVDGEALGPAALLDRLRAHADPNREPVKPGASRVVNLAEPSDAWLVLRCDRAVPWGKAEEVLVAAGSMTVRLHRIVFAALPKAGSKVGSFAVFLPSARNGGHSHIDPGPAAAIRIARRWDPATAPEDLHAALEERYPDRIPEHAVLRPDADVPTGYVLRTLDVALRSGVVSLGLQHSPPPGPHRTSKPDPAVRLDGIPVTPAGGATTRPPVPPRSPGLAGSTRVPAVRFRLEWGIEIDSPHQEEIVAGLGRLASTQNADGTWGDVADTALVLLAFLEAGEGETHKSGPHHRQIRAGLASLKQRQHRDGRFGDSDSARPHALATLAMTEAYRLTNSPLFKQSARQGLALILEDPGAPRSAWAGSALRAAEGRGLGVAAERVPVEAPRWPREDPAGTPAASAALEILGLLRPE